MAVGIGRSMPRSASAWANCGRRPVDLRTPMWCPDASRPAAHLGDVRDPAAAVAQSRLVHDQVDRRSGLLADRPLGQIHAGHHHHRLEPRQRVARCVGVQRRDRTVVAGVHRLQHVEGRRVTNLADDYAIGPHTQGILHQVADRDLASALDVGRPRLHPDHVILAQLQLRGVLDGDDALVVSDVGRQDVEGRRLARAGASGDQDVELAADAGVQEIRSLPSERAESDEVTIGERVGGELADREA